MFKNQLFTDEELKNSKCRDLMPFKCTICDKIFYMKKNHVLTKISKSKKNNVSYIQFCGQECFKKHQKIIKENNMETITCTYCKKQFVRHKNLNDCKNLFCSQSCAASFNNAVKPKRERIKKCKACDNKVKSGYKYCEQCIENGLHKNKPSRAAKEFKTCPVCKQEKSVSEFYKFKNGIGISGYCKQCVNLQSYNRCYDFKKQCVQYKGGKCEICGYDNDICAYDFHHINPSEKEFDIGKSKTWILSEKIKNELDKCLLVCCNCHREQHDKIRKEI